MSLAYFPSMNDWWQVRTAKPPKVKKSFQLVVTQRRDKFAVFWIFLTKSSAIIKGPVQHFMSVEIFSTTAQPNYLTADGEW